MADTIPDELGQEASEARRNQRGQGGINGVRSQKPESAPDPYCAPRSQSYSSRATPFPGFGNRTNTSGSCPGMINRGLVASCFIRSCAARFDLASSVAVGG